VHKREGENARESEGEKVKRGGRERESKGWREWRVGGQGRRDGEAFWCVRVC
jgi:hypothetical protein